MIEGMRACLRPFGASLAAASLVAACATSGVSPRAEASRTLRSERRLQFLLAGPAPTPSVVAGPPAELGTTVADEMAGLGLPVVHDARQAFDVEVRVAPTPPGSATMWVLLGDGRVLDQWSADPGAPRGPAHDLVEKLTRSERVCGYADSLYGRRLRPLRETIGRRSYVPGDHGGNPPFESLQRAGQGD
jgi:hypothetical protein